MEWNLVFTKTQRERLFQEAFDELAGIISLVNAFHLQDEFEITGFWGCGSKLVVKQTQLMEKHYSFSRSYEEKRDVWEYEPVSINNYLEVIEKYRVSPREVKALRQKIEHKKDGDREILAAIEKLNQLLASLTVKELLQNLQIGGSGSDFGDKLLLTREGLKEMSEGAIHNVANTDLRHIVNKYHLRANNIADFLRRIEL